MVPQELKDVSFWDLYSEVFSDTVVDALLVSCPKGVWCLQVTHRRVIVKQSNY